MNNVMGDGSSSSQYERRPSFFQQTTEEVARAAVAAAAAVRPRPSIVISSKHPSSSSFSKWKRQLQKAWKWSPTPGEGSRKNSFNPEVLTKQKRQWSDLQLLYNERRPKKEPTSIFEHFVVVGLHPSTNVEATEAAFARKKAWERELHDKVERLVGEVGTQKQAPPASTLEPQVLFKFPPNKRLPLKSKDLHAFCFPSGVEAKLMERTPSMSELNEVMYGQAHLKRDDLSFVFLLKVADNATLYGVCVLVQEIVQRLPGILAISAAMSPPSSPSGRFLVSAPRCYCILTRLPFFDLHFNVLHSIIAQERLDRITKCVSEMTFLETVPPMVKIGSKGNGIVPTSEDDPDGWMENAIPVESVLGATAAAAGLISEENVKSFSRGSPPASPEVSTDFVSAQSGSLLRPAEGSELSEAGEVTSAPSKVTTSSRADDMKVHPENESDGSPKSEKVSSCAVTSEAESGPSASPVHSVSKSNVRHERAESSESSYSVVESSMRSIDSEDEEEDEFPSGPDDSSGSEAVLAWAEANNNDSLRIICSYYRTAIPDRGSSITFQTSSSDPIQFTRDALASTAGLAGSLIKKKIFKTSLEAAEAFSAAMAAEEAISLAVWATATVCRALSLENILLMFAGALLEKQMVIVCSNLGVLSAVVLSLIPMIRPYEWQSLLLPVLPRRMLDFLDAPVPFVVGVQHKYPEVHAKLSNLIRINVDKNKVKMSSIPALPRHRELSSALEPYYTKLAGQSHSAQRHPVQEYNELQAKAAEGFLAVMKSYLDSFCTNLRSHTITNVQSNNDRVSLLLKESFIDSFASRDRSFIKLFADTQLFTVHTDAVLSSYQAS